MDFVCKRCGFECCHKHVLKRHLQRKNTCSPILSDIDVSILLQQIIHKEMNEKTYDCEYCGMKFNHRSNKSAHKKICKSAKENTSLITTNTDVLHVQIAKLTEMVAKMETKLNSNNTYNHCNVQNVVVNNFGQEDTDHLIKRMRYYFLNKTHGIVEAVKDIHFDPKHPENHNLTIKNKREKTALIRDNGKWISKHCDEVIEDLIYKVCIKVEKYGEDHGFDSKELNITQHDIERLQQWWNDVGTDAFQEKEYQHIIRRITETILQYRMNIKTN
jgi:hypothetical protein